MVSPQPTASPRLGIALMSIAMLTVPGVDGFAKALSAEHSPLFVSWARYAVATLVVLPLAALSHGAAVFPSTRRVPHFVRTLLLVCSMTLYFLAIARIPLATAMSAFFVGPIIAVVVAVTWLGEQLTPRKAASLALGFAGALIIARPGSDVDPGVLMALGAGVCFGCYLVATRMTAFSASPLQTLAFQSLVGALIMTPQAIATWSWPAGSEIWMFAGLGLISLFSHGLSISAFRHAGATTLAPLVYLELVSAAAIGYFAFAEVPDLPTLAGAACIVFAGLILVERTTRRKATTGSESRAD